MVVWYGVLGMVMSVWDRRIWHMHALGGVLSVWKGWMGWGMWHFSEFCGDVVLPMVIAERKNRC